MSKILIVEDEQFSQTLMLSRLKQYGSCQVAMDGIEAVVEVSRALQAAEPFDLICLDLVFSVQGAFVYQTGIQAPAWGYMRGTPTLSSGTLEAIYETRPHPQL